MFLTPELCLNLSQTSLVGTYLSFKTVQDIYLEVEVLEYNKTANEIRLNIINYQPKNIDKFKEQKATAQVSFVHFEPLKWQHIQKYLSSYTKGALVREGVVADDETAIENFSRENPFYRIFESNAPQGLGNSRSNFYEQNHTEFKQQEPLIEEIREEANIYFKDADFNLGFVTFPYKSKNLNETFNLKIENHFILPEFNSVKSYFPKALGGKKRFSIVIVFTLSNKVVISIYPTSSEIEGINENIIDSIKRERVANLTSAPIGRSAEKSLFTADDIFDNFDDNLKYGNVFKQSGKDILNFLIQRRGVRNAKCLQFLSGAKHSTKEKLRFTLNPLFGFLFFIEGETKNHFCWELLYSHATYIWSFDKIAADVRFQCKKVEEAINIIRVTGRDSYKNDFKRNQHDNGLLFCTIEHNKINSDFKEGFVEWQHRLKERLV